MIIKEKQLALESSHFNPENEKSKFLKMKNVDVYPHTGLKYRKVIFSDSKLSVINESRADEEIESFILDVKSSIFDKELCFNYTNLYSYGEKQQEKTIKISKLFEGKYNLSQNCFGVSLALAKLLKENYQLCNSNFHMYISVIPYGQEKVYNYKLEEIERIRGSHYFTHVFISFEHKENNVRLIFDATTSNFSHKGDLFFGTPEELLCLFKLMINKPNIYKFVGAKSIAVKLNRYIFDRIGNADELASELMKYWYGDI